jgi:hypothetical protein
VAPIAGEIKNAIAAIGARDRIGSRHCEHAAALMPRALCCHETLSRNAGACLLDIERVHVEGPRQLLRCHLDGLLRQQEAVVQDPKDFFGSGKVFSVTRRTRGSDGHGGSPDDAQPSFVRRRQRRGKPPLTVTVALERQTAEERSHYRSAVRTLLATIIELHRAAEERNV